MTTGKCLQNMKMYNERYTSSKQRIHFQGTIKKLSKEDELALSVPPGRGPQ
jgi:hypothetical protein